MPHVVQRFRADPPNVHSFIHSVPEDNIQLGNTRPGGRPGSRRPLCTLRSAAAQPWGGSLEGQEHAEGLADMAEILILMSNCYTNYNI